MQEPCQCRPGEVQELTELSKPACRPWFLAILTALVMIYCFQYIDAKLKLELELKEAHESLDKSALLMHRYDVVLREANRQLTGVAPYVRQLQLELETAKASEAAARVEAMRVKNVCGWRNT